jgi:hypothetical protein
MKKLSKIALVVVLVALASPLIVAWLPPSWFQSAMPDYFAPGYRTSLYQAFRQLTITLFATLLFATTIAVGLGYASVLSMRFGRIASSALKAVESVPSILIALFCYAPVSGYLARHSANASQLASLLVFILAATLTTLPESVRGLAIPLSDMYHKKYSLSFRSYGFTKRQILNVLMKTSSMRTVLKQTVAGILLKTLVLDCSFGFIIQLGFGSYGTPAHHSPGALIAANRDALFEGGDPMLFWLPALFLVMISTAFLFLLSDKKEANA